LGIGVCFSFDENGIAEFVRAIAVRVQFLVHAAECCVVYECSQQVIVAGAWLVRPGENSVDQLQSAGITDPMSRQALADSHRMVEFRRIFQRPHNSRADRNDSSTSRPRLADCQRG